MAWTSVQAIFNGIIDIATLYQFCYNVIMKKIVCITLAFLLVLSCCSCSLIKGKERFSKSFLDLFDTASTVIAYDDSEKAFEEHYEQFYNYLSEYDHLYDIYKSYDGIVNIYTLNNTAKDGPVKVDSRIIDLLEYCKEVYKLSDGKTNICFGAVLKLWHNSREAALADPDKAYLPNINELRSASKHTDIDDLIIDRENSTVYFADPEMKLDVGAVAKGYAVKQVTDWAKANLWSSAAISIGGNISTYGYKNDDSKTLWNIAIENPDTSSKEYLGTAAITEKSIVTSGDYQRYYMVDGKKYCHIINPDTLMPSEYVSGVSVICNDSALGDALSTTLFNMSVEDGLKLVEGMEDVEAVWVDKAYNRTYSSGFEEYLTK